MVRDLLFDIEIVGVPTVREADGLARSSRNEYLSDSARRQALSLSAGLRDAHARFRAGERMATTLVDLVRKRIEREPDAEIECVEIVDAETLESVERLNGTAAIAVAVRIGGVRLIDNATLSCRPA